MLEGLGRGADCRTEKNISRPRPWNKWLVSSIPHRDIPRSLFGHHISPFCSQVPFVCKVKCSMHKKGRFFLLLDIYQVVYAVVPAGSHQCAVYCGHRIRAASRRAQQRRGFSFSGLACRRSPPRTWNHDGFIRLREERGLGFDGRGAVVRSMPRV